MRRHVLRGILAAALVAGAGATLFSQQVLRPFGNLRLVSDTGGALAVANQGACGTLNAPVVGGNLLLSADATGALYICGDFGSGSGDIESVTAGDGLTGGGTSGAVTVNVGPGYGMDVAADTVVLDLTEILGSVTFGDGSTDTIVWTFNRATGTDPTITFNSGSIALPALTLATPLAGGQGGTGLTAFSQSGNTTVFGTTSGTLTSGDCVEFDASGNLVAAGAACGAGGSGDIEGVTAGDGLTGGGTSGTVELTIGVGLALDVSADAIAFDPTELNGSRTWGDASTDTIVWTFDRSSGTDPTITVNSGTFLFSGVTLTNGTGLPLSTGVTGDLPFANLAQCATNTILMNPSGSTADVACTDYATFATELGIVTLTDPDADQIGFWDDSEGEFAFITSMVGCSITTTVLTCTGSTSTWDGIGDSAGDGTIALAGFETDWTSSLDAASKAIWTITNTDADAGNDVPFLSLAHNDGGDANVIYLLGTGDLDGTPSVDYRFDQLVALMGSAIELKLGATGVGLLSDNDGALTFRSLSGGSAEALTFNLDDTSNAIVWSSSTGVTTWDFGAMALTNYTTTELYEWTAGVCQGSTASLGFSMKTATTPAATCADGTNSIFATADFDAATDEAVQFHFNLPTDATHGGTFTGTVSLEIEWKANSTSTDTACFCVATGSVATGGSFDPALDDVTCVNSNNTGTTAYLRNYAVIDNVDVDDWASARKALVKFYRNGDASNDAGITEDDDLSVDAQIVSLRVIHRVVKGS